MLQCTCMERPWMIPITHNTRCRRDWTCCGQLNNLTIRSRLKGDLQLAWERESTVDWDILARWVLPSDTHTTCWETQFLPRHALKASVRNMVAYCWWVVP